MKTYFPKSGDLTKTKNWHIVDAKDVVLGKLAVKVADVLRGKNKPIFSPHIDTGDFVVIINAKQVKVTGSKADQKKYYKHTGYVGNLKEFSLQDILRQKPIRIIQTAVKGMLPKNKLQKVFLKKLKIYEGSEHPHTAQQPKELTI